MHVHLINSSCRKISIILSTCVQSVILRKFITEACNSSYISRIASLSEILNCSVLLYFLVFTCSIPCVVLHFAYKLYIFFLLNIPRIIGADNLSAFCWNMHFILRKIQHPEMHSVGKMKSFLVIIKAGGTGGN